MNPIAVFHHSRISGGDPPIDFGWGVGIFAEQVLAFQESGLSEAASEMFFGVNGGTEDAHTVAAMMPQKGQLIQHPDDARGELPTLNLMWHWARSHPGWHVLYLHTKGATHLGDHMYENWRRCMMRACVWGWQHCVKDLEHGFESAGCHWLTKERYANVGPSFWGGNFYWVTSDFLMTLPEIQNNAFTRGDFYRAEVFISSGQRDPRVRDYHPAWPGGPCAMFV